MKQENIERKLITKYRAKLYRPFAKAVRQYKLIEDGDKIACCISGGKDSLVLAKLLQEYMRHGYQKFSLEFLVMDPGFTDDFLTNLHHIANYLGIPIVIKRSNIFKVAQELSKKTCSVCASMRRGFLYKAAQELNCNKIALGHHFDDVIETTILNILYNGSFKTMIPMTKHTSSNMRLIRPLVHIRERDIARFIKDVGVQQIKCGCPYEEKEGDSKRKKIKELLKQIENRDDRIIKNIFKSSENVHLEHIFGYKTNDKRISFLDFLTNEND